MGCLKVIVDFIKGIIGLTVIGLIIYFVIYLVFFSDDENNSSENKQTETTVQLSETERNKKLVEDHKYDVEAVSGAILENALGKKIESNDGTVSVYSSEELTDLKGQKYPISFAIHGKAETKQGDIIEYMMAVGFKPEKELNDYNGKGYMLEYMDMRTGEIVTNLPEEQSVFKKTVNAFKKLESGQ